MIIRSVILILIVVVFIIGPIIVIITSVVLALSWCRIRKRPRFRICSHKTQQRIFEYTPHAHI